MLHVAALGGEAVQFSAAWPFPDDRHARCPARLAPGFSPQTVDAHLLVPPLPHPPTWPASRPIHATPVCPQSSARTPRSSSGIQPLPPPPARGQRATFLGASLADIPHALPPLYRDLAWPSHAVQGAEGVGTQQGRSHGGADEAPPGPQPRRVFGRATLLPTLRPAPVAGRLGGCLRHTLRLHSAAHRCRVGRRLPPDGAGTARFPRRLAEHVPAVDAWASAIGDGQRRGAHAEDDVGLVPARLPQGRGLAIPTLRPRHLPRASRQVPAACPGMLSRTPHGAKRDRHPVQPAVPTLWGALGARPWPMTALEDQDPPRRGARGDGMGGPPGRPPGLHPRSTGGQALRQGRVGHRRRQERDSCCGCSSRLIDTAVEKAHAQEVLGGLHLFRSHKGLAGPCHGCRLRREVVQQLCTQSIGICGWHLHG